MKDQVDGLRRVRLSSSGSLQRHDSEELRRTEEQMIEGALSSRLRRAGAMLTPRFLQLD